MTYVDTNIFSSLILNLQDSQCQAESSPQRECIHIPDNAYSFHFHFEFT